MLHGLKIGIIGYLLRLSIDFLLYHFYKMLLAYFFFLLSSSCCCPSDAPWYGGSSPSAAGTPGSPSSAPGGGSGVGPDAATRSSPALERRLSAPRRHTGGRSYLRRPQRSSPPRPLPDVQTRLRRACFLSPPWSRRSRQTNKHRGARQTALVPRARSAR